jgi:hypothetical protein
MSDFQRGEGAHGGVAGATSAAVVLPSRRTGDSQRGFSSSPAGVTRVSEGASFESQSARERCTHPANRIGRP